MTIEAIKVKLYDLSVEIDKLQAQFQAVAGPLQVQAQKLQREKGELMKQLEQAEKGE